MNVLHPERLADELGQLRATAAPILDRIAEIEALLKGDGGAVFEGSQYRVSVSRYDQSRVDWKAVAAKLQPSRQLVTAHTTVSPVVRLKVAAVSLDRKAA